MLARGNDVSDKLDTAKFDVTVLSRSLTLLFNLQYQGKERSR